MCLSPQCLQRGQSEILLGKFETLDQVKQYEQQWHSLYEDSTSGLGEKVCVWAHMDVCCLCRRTHWNLVVFVLAVKEAQPFTESWGLQEAQVS